MSPFSKNARSIDTLIMNVTQYLSFLSIIKPRFNFHDFIISINYIYNDTFAKIMLDDKKIKKNTHPR